MIRAVAPSSIRAGCDGTPIKSEQRLPLTLFVYAQVIVTHANCTFLEFFIIFSSICWYFDLQLLWFFLYLIKLSEILTLTRLKLHQLSNTRTSEK